MDRIAYAKRKIREVIAASKVPEDPAHADNTLEWLLKFDPTVDPAMQVAALAHDIDRAVEERKTRRSDFDDYDAFISFWKLEIFLDICWNVFQKPDML